MLQSYKKTILLFVLIVTIFLVVDANGFNSKGECVNQIIRWCQNKDYSNQRLINALTTTYNPVVDKDQTIRCASNMYGSNCNKDGTPWLYCTSNKVVKYKNVELHPNSLTGADNEICFTAEKTQKDDFLGTVTNANMPSAHELSREMEGIMKLARQSMDSDVKEIFKSCFPFCF